ncbi:unnamed protein product, partial [Heterotrigona itama]
TKTYKAPLRLTDTPKHFNDKIALHIIGPFIPDELGHRYILSIQDCLTKYAVSCSLIEANAELSII